MITFVYNILFGLMFWEFKDAPRTPNYFSVKHIPTPTNVERGFKKTSYNRTQNK